MFSTGKDDWQTPPELFEALNAEFGFTLDVAATAENARCRVFLTDALNTRWSTPGSAWCNPPYSRGLQARFIAKAAEEARHGTTSVLLLPARTDTKSFHGWIWDRERHQPRSGVEVRFLAGRLRFVGAPASAPFPSMIVIFRGNSALGLTPERACSSQDPGSAGAPSI